jgi:hypothetical protein
MKFTLVLISWLGLGEAGQGKSKQVLPSLRPRKGWAVDVIKQGAFTVSFPTGIYFGCLSRAFCIQMQLEGNSFSLELFAFKQFAMDEWVSLFFYLPEVTFDFEPRTGRMSALDRSANSKGFVYKFNKFAVVRIAGFRGMVGQLTHALDCVFHPYESSAVYDGYSVRMLNTDMVPQKTRVDWSKQVSALRNCNSPEAQIVLSLDRLDKAFVQDLDGFYSACVRHACMQVEINYRRLELEMAVISEGGVKVWWIWRRGFTLDKERMSLDGLGGLRNEIIEKLSRYQPRGELIDKVRGSPESFFYFKGLGFMGVDLARGKKDVEKDLKLQ